MTLGRLANDVDFLIGPELVSFPLGTVCGSNAQVEFAAQFFSLQFRACLSTIADVVVGGTVHDRRGDCQHLLTDEMAAQLGGRILDARRSRGWSLADVSSRAGLSRAYINALERGRGRRPGADALRRLEDVLGPLTEYPTAASDVPEGLRQVANERRLPEPEIQMLAGLRVGGRPPVTPERWRFIYDALVASETLDRGSD